MTAMKNTGRMLNILFIVCIVSGLVTFGACTSDNASRQQTDPGQQTEETSSPAATNPVPASPPPASPATPAQNQQVPSQPAPVSNTPGTLDSTAVITKQASTMTLTLQDVGQGWVPGTMIPLAIHQAISFSNTYYTQGSAYAPSIQNQVAVYRSIANAESAYDKEKQTYTATSNPGIGDECLLNDSVAINKVLIFRKNNVVVWIWLKQFKEGDLERYGRIVEDKIKAAATAAPEQPPATTTPPAEPAPTEPPASTEPAGITKSMEGLVTKQAYDLVLSMDDMGSGWIKGNVFPPSYRYSTSASSVSYFRGAAYAPNVQNTVVVYREIKMAQDAYESARPKNATLTNPSIGDECFLNNSVPIDKLLVFRKSNVVAWVWLKQDKTGDIESYARIVEKKITY